MPASLEDDKHSSVVSGATASQQVLKAVTAYRTALRSVGGTETGRLMRSGEGTCICTTIYTSPPFDLQVPPLPVCRVSVNLTRAVVTGGLQGAVPLAFEAERYAFFLAPRGAPVHWRKPLPSRHLMIFFHADAFDGCGDSAAPVLAKEPRSNLYVPNTRGLVDGLVEELSNSSIYNAEVADSLARVLLARLARHLKIAALTAFPLSPQVLEDLGRYVQSNLTERILVADLASRVGLSASRFSSLYNEQTGQSPNQFVMAQRLHQATELLSRSRRSVAEIAHDCGFANQQHLTNSMRRLLGITPSRYRSAVLKGGSLDSDDEPDQADLT